MVIFKIVLNMDTLYTIFLPLIYSLKSQNLENFGKTIINDKG